MRSDRIESKRYLVFAPGFIQARGWAEKKGLAMAQWRMVERQDQLMGLLPQNYHIIQLPGWEGNHGARDAFRFLQTKAGFDPKEVLVVEEHPINGSSRG